MDLIQLPTGSLLKSPWPGTLLHPRFCPAELSEHCRQGTSLKSRSVPLHPTAPASSVHCASFLALIVLWTEGPLLTGMMARLMMRLLKFPSSLPKEVWSQPNTRLEY